MKLFLKQLGKSICYFLLFFGIQLIVELGIMIFYAIRYVMTHIEELPSLDQLEMVNTLLEETLASANLMSLISGILTLLILVLFFALRKKKVKEEVGLYPVKKSAYLWSLLFGICLNFVIMTVLGLLPEEMLTSYMESTEAVLGGSTVVAFLAVVIMAPIVEEVIFRGLILSRLQKAVPAWAAILITSAGFAVLHMQIIWMLYAFVLGVVLSCIAVRYKSIKPTIAFHMAFNFFGSYAGSWELPDVAYVLIIGCAVVGTVVLSYIIFKPEKRLEMEISMEEQNG